MGESDDPNPYGDPTGLDRDLMEQLRRAKERANNPVDDEPWTPEEQAELNAELARIEFKPEYAHADFSAPKVEIGGEEFEIIEFKHFPIILTVIDKLMKGEKPADNTLEEEYARSAMVRGRHYYDIFVALQRSFPALYKRSRQLREAAAASQPPPGKPITPDERRYIHSQAFIAAADIARQIDPHYDLNYLR